MATPAGPGDLAIMNPFNPRAYWEARLAGHLDLRGVGRRDMSLCYNKWAYGVRRRVFLRTLRALDVPWGSAEVLDVGAGTGFYLDRWKELGVSSVAGIDLTDASVAGLREKYPESEFYRLDIGDEMEDLRGRQFDLISCMDVLFHIVDDARYGKAIRNIHDLLKPRGLFVFSEHFLHRAGVRSLHVVHRTAETIQRCLDDAGFEVVCRRPMFVLMEEPVDSDSRVLKTAWSLRQRALFKSRLAEFVLGGALYPLELVLVSVLAESPTSEIAVCRRMR